jgi:FlaA1/EpsC-like NDP-sugar epimerase
MAVKPTLLSKVSFEDIIAFSKSDLCLFKEQIQAGGPITVTRHFTTIPEAS